MKVSIFREYLIAWRKYHAAYLRLKRNLNHGDYWIDKHNANAAWTQYYKCRDELVKLEHAVKRSLADEERTVIE